MAVALVLVYKTKIETYRAVGSSFCPRVAHFSNPSVSYNDQPTGDLHDRVARALISLLIGIAAGDPKSADCARQINEKKTRVSRFAASM